MLGKDGVTDTEREAGRLALVCLCRLPATVRSVPRTRCLSLSLDFIAKKTVCARPEFTVYHCLCVYSTICWESVRPYLHVWSCRHMALLVSFIVFWDTNNATSRGGDALLRLSET